jgi:uncharacterized NAD(P)/FAD-binding protein YdhS
MRETISGPIMTKPSLPAFLPVAQSSAGDKPPVAVIGAGFSGTMVALHLAAWLPPDQPILLCERGAFARGPAYSTPTAGHMLNVRAANMSAFPRQPDHFLDWLRTARADYPEQVTDTDAGLFASRGLFGRYLFSMLTRAAANAPNRLRTMHADVVDIEPKDGAYLLHCADGARYKVAAAVLAIGNVPPAESGSPLHFANPWVPGVAAGLRPNEPVLIVGTGLTMVDIALELRDSGFAGPVIAMSRRGLLSHRHGPTKRWPTPSFNASERASTPRLLARVRRELREAAALGVDWRSVIDSLRPITIDLWRGLPDAERARFLRHVRPYWDIHRHRYAGPVADKLKAMLDDGFLTIRRGRVVALHCNETDVDVMVRPRGAAKAERLVVQRVINASGLQRAGEADSALIAALRARGLARLDGLAMGLDVTDSLQAVGANGRPARNLWALGPIVRGMFWECIAVPDIRTQAEKVARNVWAFLEGESTSRAAHK